MESTLRHTSDWKLPRIALVILLLGSAVLGLSACSRGAGAGDRLSVEVTVNPDPPTGGTATVEILVMDAAGEPATEARVRVEGNMSHAGMKPVILDAVELEPGRYVVDPFRFTMAGDWTLTVTGVLADDTEFTRVIPVRGVDMDGAGGSHPHAAGIAAAVAGA